MDGSGTVGGAISLALDSGQSPHIAYLDAGSATLKHVYYNGALWNLQLIDNVGSISYVSLDIDSADVVQIATTIPTTATGRWLAARSPIPGTSRLWTAPAMWAVMSRWP
ncbi:MAG: hypothetical protein IPM84_14985 [Anaerolineae bacterium]|nr:hypothetical protein [Anaerolineae bacterium]